MIPKVIHYCWFSNDPFPVEIKICMDTWKRVLPDYKLRLWTMEDALSLNYPYVNEALACKKWAFAADVIRIYALYSEGGVYMDSDIFLKRRFDEFITDDFVSFNEFTIPQEIIHQPNTEVPVGIQAAFMISKAKHPFCKHVLNYYQGLHFNKEDGSLNMRISPYIYAEIAEQFGFKFKNSKQQLFCTPDYNDGITIYEAKYFAGSKRHNNRENFGIHRVSHSWKSFDDYPFLKRLEKKVKHYGRVCKYYLKLY